MAFGLVLSSMNMREPRRTGLEVIQDVLWKESKPDAVGRPVLPEAQRHSTDLWHRGARATGLVACFVF